MPNVLGRMTSVVAARTTSSRSRSGSDVAAALCGREPPQAVLDDDHGAVDDEPEVERAQAHEIAADARLDHARDRQQHRQRNDERRDERRAQVAEQREQHRDDEQRALEEVGAHGGDGFVDERRAVVHGLEAQTLGQRRVDLRELGGGGTRDDAAVLAHQHEHRAEHDFLAVHRRGAGPQVLADADVGDVADDDRRTVVRRDADPAQLVERGHLARHAHEVLAAEALDVAGADVDVVALERYAQVRERQLEREQRGGAWRDDVLPLVAADHVDLGDAGHARELRPHDPVHDRVQVGRVVRRAVRAARAGCYAQDEAEDFAQAGRDRARAPARGRAAASARTS